MRKSTVITMAVLLLAIFGAGVFQLFVMAR